MTPIHFQKYDEIDMDFTDIIFPVCKQN